MSKKVEKKIDELIHMLGESEDMIVVYKDEEDLCHYYGKVVDTVDIGETIATLVDDYYGDNIQEVKPFAEGVVQGLCAVIKRHERAGRYVAMQLMPAMTEAAKSAVENVRKRLSEMLDTDNDDDDDDEDCSNCDERYDCELEAAVRWRKQNNVPAPPRNKHRHGKKSTKGNNKEKREN